MPLKTPKYHILQICQGPTTDNPADGTTQYLGCGYSASTLADAVSIPSPITGIITAVYIKYYLGVVGTNENWTHSLQVASNNTALGNVVATASPCTLNATGLSAVVNAGDLISIKRVNPTWVTNPTDTRIEATILINSGY